MHEKLKLSLRLKVLSLNTPHWCLAFQERAVLCLFPAVPLQKISLTRQKD